MGSRCPGSLPARCGQSVQGMSVSNARTGHAERSLPFSPDLNPAREQHVYLYS